MPTGAAVAIDVGLPRTSRFTLFPRLPLHGRLIRWSSHRPRQGVEGAVQGALVPVSEPGTVPA